MCNMSKTVPQMDVLINSIAKRLDNCTYTKLRSIAVVVMDSIQDTTYDDIAEYENLSYALAYTLVTGMVLPQGDN